MTIDEVRQIWLPRAEAKTKTILDRYYAMRRSHGPAYGREGLGIYGQYQGRAAREKVRLAVTLLEKAGHEVSYGTIRRVTQQSENTIMNYWAPPIQDSPEKPMPEVEQDLPPIFKFPGVPMEPRDAHPEEG